MHPPAQRQARQGRLPKQKLPIKLFIAVKNLAKKQHGNIHTAARYMHQPIVNIDAAVTTLALANNIATQHTCINVAPS